MVASQIRGRGIADRRVLAALATVPRHRFVPPSLERSAYDDAPLPVGHGQTISQPYIVALMTAALRPQRHHRVLEIGTGTGYQTAVLAHLVARVYTIERLAVLAETAEVRLAGLGYRNVACRVGDGTLGWPEAGPFDGIVVTAAAPSVPAPLLAQLAPGGRLAVPVGGLELQDLRVVERSGEGYREWSEGGCRFVPLIGLHGFAEGV